MPQAQLEKSKDKKGQRTRQLLKDKTLEIYKKADGKNVPLSKILEDANLTVGAFYFHFKSKDELLEEVVIDNSDGYHEAIIQAVDWEADFHEIARGVIGKTYRSYVENPVLMKLSYSMVYRSPKAYSVWLQNRKQLRREIERAIKRAIVAPKQSNLDPAFLSHWLLSSLEDFLFAVFMAKGTASLRKVAASEEAFVDQQATIWARSVLGADPAT